MSLKEKILADLKEAMKQGEGEKRDALRLLSGAIKNVEIEKLKKETGLLDEEVVEVIARAVKQRRDSIEQFRSGQREDLVAKEQKEIDIFSVYLPAQLSPEEISSVVKEVIATTGASSMADFGKVMGETAKRLKGRAEGGIIRKAVEAELKPE